MRQSYLKLISFICAFQVLAASAQPMVPSCQQELSASCIANLHNYPLFDTEYKLAANYIPILPLRALVHADVYKEKKTAHLERYFYIKDLQGKFSKPYETLILDIEVRAKGLLGREVIAKGKLNEFDVEYLNTMSFSLPRNAQMKVSAKLDKIKILDLIIKSDGKLMKNEVSGSFLGKDVLYNTIWRETEGMLADIKYTLHTEGVDKEPHRFTAITRGKIGSTDINGQGKLVKANYYEFTENYGPVQIKSYLTIKN